MREGDQAIFARNALNILGLKEVGKCVMQICAMITKSFSKMDDAELARPTKRGSVS